MSIGLGLVFGVMRVVNFAHGDFMMLGMYLTYFYAVSGHVDPLLGAVLTLPPFFLLGVLVHRAVAGRVVRLPGAVLPLPPFFLLGVLVHRAVLGRVTGGGDPARQQDAQLIVTLGLSLLLTHATTILL